MIVIKTNNYLIKYSRIVTFQSTIQNYTEEVASFSCPVELLAYA